MALAIMLQFTLRKVLTWKLTKKEHPCHSGKKGKVTYNLETLCQQTVDSTPPRSLRSLMKKKKQSMCCEVNLSVDPEEKTVDPGEKKCCQGCHEGQK